MTIAASTITPSSRCTIETTTTRCSSAGQLAHRGRGLKPAAVEHRLGGGDPQLLAHEGDGQRQQPVDQVQARLLVAEGQQHAAERDLEDDTAWPARSRRQNRGLERTRYQHQAPHRPAPVMSAIDEDPDDEMDDLHDAAPYGRDLVHGGLAAFRTK